jgi:hypothetical protein
MSINAISGSSQSLSAIVGAGGTSRRHGDDGDRESSGDGIGPGLTLFASLLEALTQAARQPAATSSTGTGAGTASIGTTGAGTSSTVA